MDRPRASGGWAFAWCRTAATRWGSARPRFATCVAIRRLSPRHVRRRARERSGEQVREAHRRHVAGTFVVHEQLAIVAAAPALPAEGVAAAAITSRLTEDEYALLGRFVSRRAQLEPELRSTIRDAARGSLPLAHLLKTEARLSAQLLRLYESEAEARARGLPSRGAGRGARAACDRGAQRRPLARLRHGAHGSRSAPDFAR